MNSEYLQLREDPFGTLPDPRFLYEAESHSQAAATLITNLDNGVRVQVLVSPHGLGKTTLLHSLMECACRNVNTILIENPRLDVGELLSLMIENTGGELPAEASDYQSALIGCLLESPMRHLLIIDDAEGLDHSVLEVLNEVIEATRRKLQVVLSGCSELPRNLKRTSYSLLRIARIVELKQIEAREIAGYVAHRLCAAGYEGPPIFDNDTAKMIYEQSDGVPRVINELCSEALNAAARLQSDKVDANLLEKLPPWSVPKRIKYENPEASTPEPTDMYPEPKHAAQKSSSDDLVGLLKNWLTDHAKMWVGTAGELALQLRPHANQSSPLSQSVTCLNIGGMVEVNIEGLRRAGVEAKISSGLPRLITLRLISALEEESSYRNRPEAKSQALREHEYSAEKQNGDAKAPPSVSSTDPVFTVEELAAVDDLLARFIESAPNEQGSDSLSKTAKVTKDEPELLKPISIEQAELTYQLPSHGGRERARPVTRPVAAQNQPVSYTRTFAPPRSSQLATALPPPLPRKQIAAKVDGERKLITLPASIPPQQSRLTTVGVIGILAVVGVLFLVGFLAVSYSALSATETSDTNNAKFALPTSNTSRDLSDVDAAQLLALAKSGDAGAQYELGRRYSNGIGTHRDNKQALKWLRRSAEWGHAEAQFQLARMLAAAGELPEAYTWLVLAYTNGEPKAKEESNLLAARLSGEQLATARFQTGQRFSEGLGVSRDYPAAYAWFRLASATGSKEALERMATLKLRLRQKDMAEVQREYSSWLVTQLR